MKRKALLAFLGLVTALMALQLTFALALRKTRVDLLVEVLASSDPGDAAWAFEQLNDLDLASLEVLLPHLRSRKATFLRAMSWRSSGFGGTTNSSDCYQVWEVARFVLSSHLLGKMEHEDWTPGLVERYRGALGEALRAEPDRARPIWKKWFGPVPPRVTPPSKDQLTAALAAGGSAEALLTFLKGADRAEAAWGLTRLRALPDEELSKLFPLASAAESTLLKDYACVGLDGATGSSYSSSKGFSVGQVVVLLIAERVGATLELSELTSNPVSAHLLEKLSRDLNERLACAAPALEVR